jgi:hypothetical protein
MQLCSSKYETTWQMWVTRLSFRVVLFSVTLAPLSKQWYQFITFIWRLDCLLSLFVALTIISCTEFLVTAIINLHLPQSAMPDKGQNSMHSDCDTCNTQSQTCYIISIKSQNFIVTKTLWHNFFNFEEPKNIFFILYLKSEQLQTT